MQPNSTLCPPTVRDSFLAYRDHGTPPGSFVRACLENNLLEAFKCADDTNREVLPHIVAWLYWEMPINLWKSKQAVDTHILAMKPAEPERDEPIVYQHGELPPRDCRDEHDRTL